MLALNGGKGKCELGAGIGFAVNAVELYAFAVTYLPRIGRSGRKFLALGKYALLWIEMLPIYLSNRRNSLDFLLGLGYSRKRWQSSVIAKANQFIDAKNLSMICNKSLFNRKGQL